MKKLVIFVLLFVFLIAPFTSVLQGLTAIVLWVIKISCALFALFLIAVILDRGNESSRPDDNPPKNTSTQQLSNYELERYARMCNADLKRKDEMEQYEQSSQEQNNKV